MVNLHHPIMVQTYGGYLADTANYVTGGSSHKGSDLTVTHQGLDRI